MSCQAYTEKYDVTRWMGHNGVLLNESVNENLPCIEPRMHNQRYVSGTQGGAKSESHNINNVYVYCERKAARNQPKLRLNKD